MKKNWMKLFAFLVAMLTVLPALAQEVDEATAQERALRFLQRSASRSSRSQGGQASALSIKLAHTSTGDKGNNYYAFNVGNNEGFIIMSAEERAVEVLGYADEGTFDYAAIPANLKWWLSEYDKQIAAVRQSESALTRAASSAGSDKVDISPLITTKWNQTPPYNSKIPVIDERFSGYNGFATGCVATAIAQIMKYYGNQLSGKGSKSYQKAWSVDGQVRELTFEADFEHTAYDWDNMLDVYTGSESQAEIDAVATLMYHVGVACNMDYGLLSTGGSGASTSYAPIALTSYFNFDKSAYREDRSLYTNQEWEDLVYSELSQKRPVLYSGFSTTGGGHAFVCAGYRASDNHFFINWGWGGMCDGYYVLTATPYEIPLQPSESGAGGAGYGASYTEYQDIVKNLIPDAGGDYLTRVYNSEGYTIDRETAKNGESLTISGGFFNGSIVKKRITFGVRLTNVHTGETYYSESYKNVDLEPRYGFMSYYFYLNNLPTGAYEVSPVFYESLKSEEWIDMFTSTRVAPLLYVGDFEQGDANADGDTNVGDITDVVSHILGKEPRIFNSAVADANQDGNINVGDISTIVAKILSKQ